MAESDTAGPAPDGPPSSRKTRPRRVSIGQILRDIDRATEPIRQEVERAQTLKRQIDAFTEPTRRMLAEFGVESGDEAAGPIPEPQNPRPPRPPEKVSPTRQRPVFEEDPPKDFVASLKKAFPGFVANDRWWSRIQRHVIDLHWHSSPADHEDFCAAYWEWTAADLLTHLVDLGLLPKPRRPRGLTVCERLRSLHKEDADFAETAPERQLAKRIGKEGPGCFSKSAYWINTLKPRRAVVRAQKRKVMAAKRYGDFDSVGRRDEETEGL
jgi:hypothetical protein